MSLSRHYHISPTGTLTFCATLAEAQALAKVDGYVWLDYCAPTKTDLAPLLAPYSLHPLSIEDCTDDIQIPKLDAFPGYTFLLFNAITYENDLLVSHEVDVFLGAQFVITVSGYDTKSQPLLANLPHLVEKNPAALRQGPAFLLYLLLDFIVDQKFIAIEALEEEINRVEEQILADARQFKVTELLHLRRDLLSVRKSIYHEREILVKLCRKDSPFVPESAIFFYRDIYDHLAKFFELTEAAREIVTSLMEMYLSLLNNEMAKAANDTNRAMRRLTMITTIFMPLTLLAGIGGMSEWTMMVGQEHWVLGYSLLLLALALMGLATYGVLKWLERHR